MPSNVQGSKTNLLRTYAQRYNQKSTFVFIYCILYTSSCSWTYIPFLHPSPNLNGSQLTMFVSPTKFPIFFLCTSFFKFQWIISSYALRIVTPQHTGDLLLFSPFYLLLLHHRMTLSIDFLCSPDVPGNPSPLDHSKALQMELRYQPPTPSAHLWE